MRTKAATLCGVGALRVARIRSVTNQAGTPPQAALNATISGTAPITASGSFTLLTPGQTNATSLQVGMNTAAAGAINGTATLGFVSDASNVGGCAPNCQLTLPSQNVTVTGGVYRLANPVVNTSAVALAARVGDASPTGAISITNSSPDAYTEGLNVTRGGTAAGFSSSGNVNNLAAGGASGTIQVALNTSAAGTFTGQQVVNFISTGAGTTNAPDLSVGTANVSLNGKVYTPAQATVGSAPINFGIVHVGDAVAQKAIAVTNSAPVTALNDTLTGNVAASGPFTASGALAGVAAGATDNSSLKVGINTASAGNYSSSATLQLQSHNPDMSNLTLASQTVSLVAQVNNYARPVFEQVAGGFSLTQSGSTFALDFGDVTQGTGTATAGLGVRNAVAGPADILGGTFDLGVGSSAFQFTGFNSFADIAGGNLFGGLSVGLDTTTLGLFDYSIVFHPYGTNASGFLGSLGDLTLSLHGNVVASAPVPEPSTLLLFGTGLAGLAGWRWRNRGKR